jgi:hypothetical protein
VLNDAEMSQIADAWIALVRSEEDSEEHEKNFWSFATIWNLTLEAPIGCWGVILTIFKKDRSELILDDLAAGPIESLLAFNGRKVIGLLENAAVEFPEFRAMLSGVWRNAIPEDVWQRLQKVIAADDTSKLQ